MCVVCVYACVFVCACKYPDMHTCVCVYTQRHTHLIFTYKKFNVKFKGDPTLGTVSFASRPI